MGFRRVIAGLMAAGAVWHGAAASGAVNADYARLIGYDQLVAWVGDDLPTGAGVAVTQVEVRTDQPPLGDPAYFPNTTNATAFGGKTITPRSRGSLVSGHATNVANIFYANDKSIAAGITSIDVYEQDHWIGAGFLMKESGFDPGGSSNASRIANHSWVSNESNHLTNLDVLQRVDWLVETREYLQIVGNGNPVTSNLLHAAFNVIAVSSITGAHRISTNNLSHPVYVQGRSVPHLVVGFFSTPSDSTASVSSAAALLIGYSQAHPELSNDDFTAGGMTIRHGDSSDAIKAMLMAGASRRQVTVTPNNYTYQVNTENGLDRRFGAGAMNVFNSFAMLRAGETDSAEDAGIVGGDGGMGQIGDYGFDYDRRFGGLNGVNARASYEFTTGVGRNWLTATLAWNLDIDGGAGSVFNGAATLYDLDLKLFDITDGGGGDGTLVAQSAGTINNTETIWRQLKNDRRYRMVVEPKAGQAAFAWRYALAWRLVPDIGDFDGDGDVDHADADLLLAALGGTDLRFDTNGDGVVNLADRDDFVANGLGTALGDTDGNGLIDIADLSRLASFFGGTGGWTEGNTDANPAIDIADLRTLATWFGYDSTTAAAAGTAGGGTVPEPATWMLTLAGIALGAARRRRSGA